MVVGDRMCDYITENIKINLTLFLFWIKKKINLTQISILNSQAG